MGIWMRRMKKRIWMDSTRKGVEASDSSTVMTSLLTRIPTSLE